MKSILNGILLTLFLTQICFAQWFWRIQLPQGNRLQSGKFVSLLPGRAVDDSGMALHTTNNAQNWAPLEVGNKWQYNRRCNNQTSWNSINYVEKDSIISGKKYFLLQGAINDWVRYDDEENILYLRWNDSDYTVMDFSLNEGEQFEHIVYNSHSILNATVLESTNINLFDTTFFSKGYRWSINYNESDRVYHSETLGETQDSLYAWGGGTQTNCSRKLIRAIIYDSSGIKYYSDGVKPEIIFEPQPVIHNFSLNWDFSVDHDCSGFGNYWNENFIDTVSMISYYSNGDSVVSNSPVEAINELNTINYNITYQLDSTLMKNNFNFYYKIYAVDKGIVPEASWEPDSGYYELVYDPNPVSVKDENIPIAYTLQQNYPNPFNNSSVIIYSIPKSSQVLMNIYNTLGEVVKTLINENKPAGNYEIEFNASTLPNGVYFYQLRAGDFVQTKKMLLVK